MKIDSASYSLASSHQAATRDETRESLRIWQGDRRPDFESRESAAPSAVSLSSAARAWLASELEARSVPPPTPQSAAPAPAPQTGAAQDAADAVDSDPFLMLIKSMVEMLTGRPMRLFSAKELQHQEAPPPLADPNAAAEATPPQATAAKPAGFGIEYDYHAVHEESEQTRVSAEGSIRTRDGQEISFRLELAMTRSYREETSLSLRAGDAVRKDPLVLNFNGAAAQLSDQRFSFDLDSDGKRENLALLAGGSGYLAIDRNGNGRIDSGRELFGPATNSGFGELAALDGDGNGWIDENDSGFAALRVWMPGATGDGTLQTLAQRKVGAIALGSVASPFELRGAANGNLGAVAATGIFLGEDGTVGTVQEVDLTV